MDIRWLKMLTTANNSNIASSLGSHPSNNRSCYHLGPCLPWNTFLWVLSYPVFYGSVYANLFHEFFKQVTTCVFTFILPSLLLSSGNCLCS